MAHICPVLPDIKDGPLHIPAKGVSQTAGTVICEQIKLVDLALRNPRRVDRLPYEQIMNVSDAIQGIFEYD